MTPPPANSTQSQETAAATRKAPAHRPGAASPVGTDAEGLLRELTTRQHLAPHKPLKDVVAEIVDATGVCPDAADRAQSWLNLPSDRPIGRLRRGELIQLARSMYRFWLESLGQSPSARTSP